MLASSHPARRLPLAALALALVLPGCVTPQGPAPPQGRGQPGELAAPSMWEGLILPPGVVGEVVAQGLDFPTALDWDDRGTLYVGEVGFTNNGPRVLRIGEGGQRESLDLSDASLTEQLLDITHHHGTLYITTSGKVHALDLANGTVRELLSGLPASGDHRTNEVVVGPDGRLYVGQGSATNSGVVGLDQLGVPDAVSDVLSTDPGARDVPCAGVTASGANYETADPRASNVTINAMRGAGEDSVLRAFNATDAPAAPQGRALTGPFAPFGQPRVRGEAIAGDERCSGAVISMAPDGSDVRPVAWGFRNPFALKFGPDGALWVADNGPDHRGSRPVGAAPDALYRVALGQGAAPWHGWPDFVAGKPLTDPFFAPIFGPPLVPLLDPAPGQPPAPVTFFSNHASANKFDVAPAGSPLAGDIVLAEFGTMNVEFVMGALTGMDVVRVNASNGRVTEFIIHQDRYTGGFRPVEARFGPDGRLYVVDFGAYKVERGEAAPPAGGPGGGNASVPDPGTSLTGDGSGGNATDGNATVGNATGDGSTNATAQLPGGAALGPSTRNVMSPGTGRVLAFRLPASLAWEGRPVGNVGGQGLEMRGGEVRSAPLGSPVVNVFEYGFAGPSAGARAGEPIAFRNVGKEGHTVTEVGGLFNSGMALARNATWVWTPPQAGNYTYYCEVHPVMRATLRVAP